MRSIVRAFFCSAEAAAADQRQQWAPRVTPPQGAGQGDVSYSASVGWPAAVAKSGSLELPARSEGTCLLATTGGSQPLVFSGRVWPTGPLSPIQALPL